MSTVWLMWTGGGREVKNLIFCGRHKWMAPYIKSRMELRLQLWSRHKAKYILQVAQVQFAFAELGMGAKRFPEEVLYKFFN